MLNQEDKHFISKAVSEAVYVSATGLRAEIQDLKAHVDGQFLTIDARFEKVETGIRHNGVMMENLQGVVYSIAEGVSVVNDRLDRVEKDVAEIKENIADLPTIRRMVKRHDRQLATLSR